MMRAGCAALAAVLGGCGAADAGAVRGVDHAPAAALERLASAPLSTDDVGIVYDFDMDADTLFVLDRTGRVLVIARRDTAWQLVRSFGGRGWGPGEFTNPSGISVNDTAIVVVDGVRLQSFTRDGEIREALQLDLPCAMLLPGVALVNDGVFIHGNCVRGSFVTDTVKSVLAWSDDLRSWRSVAEEIRFTRDGKAGNIFSATNALTPYPGGLQLFGTGATNCVWLISDASPPAGERRCDIVHQLYRADPPAELRARLRGVGGPSAQFEWPPALPAFVERVSLPGGRLLLVRPYSTDSAVLQLAAPESRDVAVAPMNGLVGCKAGACLWALQAVDGVRLIVLDSAAMRRRTE